eukprot:323735-Ditylum_brightwellii.AAC.1
MTQHKEECGEDEEGNLKIISGIGEDKDSGEECGKEGEVEVGNSEKAMQCKHLLGKMEWSL